MKKIDNLQIEAIERRCLLFNLRWQNRGMVAYREGFSYVEELLDKNKYEAYCLSVGFSEQEIKKLISNIEKPFVINTKEKDDFLENVKSLLVSLISEDKEYLSKLKEIPIGGSPNLEVNAFFVFNQDGDEGILIGKSILDENLLDTVVVGCFTIYHFLILNDIEKLFTAASCVSAIFSSLFDTEKSNITPKIIDDFGLLYKEVKQFWDKYGLDEIITTYSYNLIYFLVGHELGHVACSHQEEYRHFISKYGNSTSVHLKKEISNIRKRQEYEADFFSCSIISSLLFKVKPESYSKTKVLDSITMVLIFYLLANSVERIIDNQDYPEITDRYLNVAKMLLGDDWLHIEGNISYKRILEGFVFLSKLNFERGSFK